jgi:hypothetical protein
MLNNTLNLGPQWNGSPKLITQNQLTSTTSGILKDVTGISTLTVSTFITLTTQSFRASTISTGTFTANIFAVDTINANRVNTNSISSMFFTGGRMTVSSLSTGSMYTGFISTTSLYSSNATFSNATIDSATIPNITGNLTGNLTGDVTGSINGNNGTFNNLTVNNSATFNNAITDFKRHTLSNVNTIHSGGCNLLTSNITLIATNAIDGIGKGIAFEANEGSLVAANARVLLRAKNGNRGLIELDSLPGYAGIQGEINLKATGGSPAGVTPLGGRIHLSATNPNSLTSVSPSYVLQTADSILAYAGGLSPISGNYGYNYQQGLNGVNIVAGTVATIPNVLGTVYLYGTNLSGTGNSGGVRISNGLSVDVIYPYPTGFISPDYDLILKGNTAGNKVSLSNVRNIQGDGGDFTGFYTLFTSNISANYLTANSISTATMNVSSIFSSNISTNFITSVSSMATSFYASSLRVSTINGFVFLGPAGNYSTITAGAGNFSSLTTSSLQLVNNPAFSMRQVFVSTTTQPFSFISSATNNILSTSVTLTSATLPEIGLVNEQIFNNGNISYWASTICVAQPTDLSFLTNTLGALGPGPNTGGLILYKNVSGVPLGIRFQSDVGPTTLIIPQNSNYQFAWSNSSATYWDVTTNPTLAGGTYGTSFSIIQNYNNTKLTSPDIITLDAPLVNVSGTLGDIDIINANVTTATINQMNSSTITLLNTPTYSIEQSFLSTTTSAFNFISSATNYILSTSIALTATTAATNPIIQNFTIQTKNIDYWASTIQVATDIGATPTFFNQLITLSNAVFGQVSYKNDSLTKIITINRFGDQVPAFVNIPSGSNYQFTWTGTGWNLNQNPTNTTATFDNNFSLSQTFNNITLKTQGLLTLDSSAVNITGPLNGVNITTANIVDATVNQIQTSTIIMNNSPTFSIQQSFFSTTINTFDSISSVKNLIISTSTGFTASSREQQPFIDNFRANATNIGTWASTTFLGPITADTNNNFLTDLRGNPITGGQIDYTARANTIFIFSSGASGGQSFSVPSGSTYRYTWDGNNWNQSITAPPTSATFGTSLTLFQDYYNTTFISPDTITLDSAALNITGVTKINQLNLNNLDISTINTSNITATNGTITNLNTVTENTRIMNYSTIVGNPAQGALGINQNTNYTTIGRTLNLASNLQYSLFPNISSIASQTVFNNTINYNRYPGGFFQLMLGSVGGQQLFDNGTITSPTPITGQTWYSSIMGIQGAPPGPLFYPFTVPTSQRGEFLLLGTAAPRSQYQINFGGASNQQISIDVNQYHRWTNLTGAGWTNNLNSAVVYPTIPTTETAALVMQPGGLLNLNTQYLGFGPTAARFFSYHARVEVGMTNSENVGKGSTDFEVNFQGKKFSASEYNCTVAITEAGASQTSLAISKVSARTFVDANNNWRVGVVLRSPTITGNGVVARWSVQITLIPLIFASGTKSDGNPDLDDTYITPIYNDIFVSSMMASTLSMYSSENIYINAGINPTPLLGANGLIGLNASTNIDLMANNDINLDAFQNIYLTANSSITLSNVANTAAIGFDETASSFIGGSNVFITAQDTFINSFNNTLIEGLSTINNTPNFVVSTNMNSYTIRNVRQPFIQYGEVAGSSNNGNVQVILPVAYSSINSYKAFVTMEDNEPAEMSAVRDSENAFTIYWQQAHSGNHIIAWNTMGDLGEEAPK